MSEGANTPVVYRVAKLLIALFFLGLAIGIVDLTERQIVASHAADAVPAAPHVDNTPLSSSTSWHLVHLEQ